MPDRSSVAAVQLSSGVLDIDAVSSTTAGAEGGVRSMPSSKVLESRAFPRASVAVTVHSKTPSGCWYSSL